MVLVIIETVFPHSKVWGGRRAGCPAPFIALSVAPFMRRYQGSSLVEFLTEVAFE